MLKSLSSSKATFGSINLSGTNLMPLDSRIYKVKQIINGSINTIYVFNGKKTAEDEENLFKKIFTDEENEQIKSEKIQVKFSEQQIHFDDSIGTIKIKILKELKTEILLDEIYLYCQKIETLNAVSVYQSLTQNNKLQLTKVRLDQFISNIVSDEDGNLFSKPVDKDIYNFDDIFEMKFDDKKYIINKVLGQKFFIVENEYPFICDPYDVQEYDKFFEKSARKSLTTLNSHLLLSSGEIVNNSIYLCLAENVVSYLEKKDVSEETTIKIYYPFLYNKNINSLEDLNNNKSKLIELNKKILNEKTFDSFNSINMFYDIYNLKKTELNYVNKGIKYIKAVVKPEFDVKIPLEIIFKIIHATQENPLIKYNPSSRQENVYRLFTDKIATDGRKIPYLKKSTVFKLMKNIARNKSVAIYVETSINGSIQSLICEFDEEGFITISSEFKTVVSVHDIDNIFKNSINPIIIEIKNLLEQSGYKLNKFNSLNDENVEIKQLTYETKIIINKPLDIETYRGCISSIFINETNVFKGNTINLRFKRVANYSKFSSQEAFILEKSEQGLRGDQIIEALLENFHEDLNRQQAVEMVRKVANELEIERGVRKSDIKIKNNPGFKTVISLEKETGIITITTENINNINYLYTLPIYLDTMVRLTQDKNSTNYSTKEINALCSTGEKEDIYIADIISSSEESAPDSEVPSIKPDEEEVQYTKFKNVDFDKPKGALSLFFDEDEDEEEDIFEGGTERKGKGVDSESSISSAASDEESLKKELDSFGIDSSSESEISSDKTPSEIEMPIVAPNASSKSDISSDETLSKIEMPTLEPNASYKSDISSDKTLSEIEMPTTNASSKSDISSDKTPSEIEMPTLNPSESKSDISSDKTPSEIEIPTTNASSKSDISSDKTPSEIEIPTLNPSASSESKSDISSDKTPSEIEMPTTNASPSTNGSESEISSDKTPSKIIIPTLDPSASSKSEVSSDKTQNPSKIEMPTLIPSTSSSSKQSEKILKKQSDVESEEEVEYEEEEEVEESKKKKVSLKKKKPVKIPEYESDSDEEEKTIKNIDGMKLNKPYYFQTLIEKKDPILILKEDTPQYNSYPRTCSSNMRRQPVILTDTQLDKIKKDNPGFLREEDVIKYGSNPKNQYNYICPRFWCLKNNTFIDPKDLKEVTGKDGKTELVHPTCGKVLPKGEKKVKPGYYIYEFYKPKPGKKDYKKYPGLIPDSHPDGLCLPCCFDKYNTEGRIKANDKCFNKKAEEKPDDEKPEDDKLEDQKPKDQKPKEEEKEDKGKKQKKDEIQNKEEDEYIKGPDKFPLESGRWGYLPVEIQTMLHEANADCQISKTNSNIKENHPCLLRHGVEVNDKQSFIACISDTIFFGKRIHDEENKLLKKTSKILSIKEMRERIIKAISIDTFIKYQNGNLVIDFNNENIKVDFKKYANSKIFSKLNIEKPEDKAYFSKVVSSYENFINFLKDDDAVIDHTYLWDIISMPNKYLFPNGVNLVIFHLPKDDITNNVQLLCPTNHYSTEYYEARKPTIILMKEEGYYEPIYSYSTNNKMINISKEFKEYDPQLSKTMRAVFKEIIKPFFNLICKPLESMPNVYKAKRPLLLYDLVQKLDKYEYKIKKMVLNFNNKVIGVIAEEPALSDKRGFIPCYPSALDEDLKKNLDFVFMTDLTLWNTYKHTVQFLSKLDKRSKKRRDEADIPCKPAFKVIEDEHVVGILTNTNQFIQISQPIRIDEIDTDIDIDIPSIDNDNYIVNVKTTPMIQSEIEITTQKDVDKERVDYIKKIRLETSFYNVFRNTIRILINDYENAKIRTEIEKEMLKEYIIYSEKLTNIDKLLRELVKDKIQFIGDDNYYKLINEVSTCIVKDKDSCSSTPNLCAVTENGKCNLILPEKNLITNKVNEPIYYGRMSDELIRYNRIKSFMLQPKMYLSFGNIGYNLRDNEIILIQSLLAQYFETLVPAATNKYVKYNSYDEVQPIISQVYENTIPSLDHAIGRKNEIVCDKVIKDHITSSMWRKCFPENYTEIEYSKFNYCTFSFIIDLIEKKTGITLTINKVKNELFEEYKKYLNEYHDKIIDILILEGKKTLGDQVHSQTLTFASLLYTDNYFLTTFDLWLLITKYKIPTIFICQKWILQTKYEKHEFVGYGNEDDKFAFIVIPGFRPENVPGYKLIQSATKDIFISLEKVSDNCIEQIKESIRNAPSINDYLQNFTKPLTTDYEKKKPTRLVIESDSEEIKPEKEKEKEKEKKRKLIIEDTTPISSEEFILLPNKKKSRKRVLVRNNKNKTANKNKRRLLIVDSSSTEKI
jgi:hypothetical protein